MPFVRVDLAERSYDVIVEAGLLHRTGEAILQTGIPPCRVAIVTDSNVVKYHSQALTDSLIAAGFQPTLHIVPAGESSKSMTQAEAVCREMIRENHDRKSLLVALGGGVVGDLAGFIAAIFYRGIPFIQIPTTFLACVDSSVGGKTGVNVTEGKNLLGAFHQPKRVLVDPETLRTLPAREYHEGFAEAIKHAAIRDAEMLQELAALDPESRDIPADLIARNIAIKARVVEEDEYETKDVRALLNLGHTIGHGIEAAVPYGQLLHGEAISLGLRAALYLSEKKNQLSSQDAATILSLLEHYNLPTLLPDSITTDTVMERLSRDKKFSSGQIRFVLLSALGKPFVSREITRQDLIDAIEHLRKS